MSGVDKWKICGQRRWLPPRTRSNRTRIGERRNKIDKSMLHTHPLVRTVRTREDWWSCCVLWMLNSELADDAHMACSWKIRQFTYQTQIRVWKKDVLRREMCIREANHLLQVSSVHLPKHCINTN